jgi:hypothetical protein
VRLTKKDSARLASHGPNSGSIPPDIKNQISVSVSPPLFCHMSSRAKVKVGGSRLGSRAPFSREMQAGLGDASMAMFRRAAVIFTSSRLSVNRLSWGVRALVSEPNGVRSLRPAGVSLDRFGALFALALRPVSSAALQPSADVY